MFAGGAPKYARAVFAQFGIAVSCAAANSCPAIINRARSGSISKGFRVPAAELVQARPIDWAGIRANAVTMGIRAAARSAARDLPDIEQDRFVERVLKRAQREEWMKAKEQAMSSAVVINEKPLSANVHTGADSIAKTLADDSNATKIGFSTAARKVATKISAMKPNLDKDRAQAVRHWAGVASSVHGWQDEKGGDRRVMINIGILTE